MPDPIAHATQGSLILLGPFIAFVRRRIWVGILVLIGGSLGDLPDLLGIYGYMVERDNGALYESAHRGEIAETLQYLPMYWLHIRLDEVTHDRHSYITRDWFWIEIVVWIINLLLIWLYVKIFRKHREVILPRDITDKVLTHSGSGDRRL
jgi:hypothetical protein